MRTNLALAACLAVGLVGTPAAQVVYRPVPPPIVTADNADWYRFGEPITFSGSFYYPAGAIVFFDGDEMARVGDYRGIPLYTETTIEPYSIILVPLSGGLVRPYERRRTDRYASSTGSRPPSFPVATSGEVGMSDLDLLIQESVLRALPVERRVDADAPPSVIIPPPAVTITPPDLERQGRAARESAGRRAARSRPASNPKGIWIEYAGTRWTSDGLAVPLSEARFTRIGEYHGFPVYEQRGSSGRSRIFLPTSPGMLAPYRKAAG